MVPDAPFEGRPGHCARFVLKLNHSGPSAAIGFKNFGQSFACIHYFFHLSDMWEPL